MTMGHIHSWESMGLVDGPGIRTVIFLQGCRLRCQYCHNPDTWEIDGRAETKTPEEIIAVLNRFKPYYGSTGGVTFSGGEPTLQAKELVPIARAVVEDGKYNVIFSGYTFEELMKRCETEPELWELLGLCRYLIDGRYVHEQRDLTLHFRGSRNQRIIDLPASLPSKTPVVVEQ